jgi:hypothetical protein
MSAPLNIRIFLVLVLVFAGAALVANADPHLPNNHQGYTPEQPVQYSHRVHAGELSVDCLYCHSSARNSRHAGIPQTTLCMNCHKTVTSGFDAKREEELAAEAEGREPVPVFSDEIRKIYDALALDDNAQRIPGKQPSPIEWVKVHNMPDFVYFDHRVHVARGLACQTCHGPVESMERMTQFSDLSMGWCIDCHRTSGVDPDIRLDAGQEAFPEGEHVSTDCASCHY